MKMKNTVSAYELESLALFREIREREDISALSATLTAKTLSEKLSAYSKFVSLLGGGGEKLSDVILSALAESENAYTKKIADGEEIPKSLKKNLEAELKILGKLTRLTPKEIFEDCNYEGYIPSFENEKTDILEYYTARMKNIEKCGYGIFSKAGMFRLDDGRIVPVASADSIGVESFVGYEEERRQVIENTRALAEGKYAANVLLCGDAGTGKSSTVKAASNMFYEEGVRLIEIRKDQLFSLPHVMEKIMNHPLKFIIFIDDLSFNKNDDCFSMLKAALEGSSSVKTDNAAIYVTSNRRHIIKETFADRGDDDIHRGDTVEELMSLSGRFGLTVYFQKPSKQLYLEIVRSLAERFEIKTDTKELEIKAEAFALMKGSRSPRCAEQFVKSLL